MSLTVEYAEELNMRDMSLGKIKVLEITDSTANSEGMMKAQQGRRSAVTGAAEELDGVRRSPGCVEYRFYMSNPGVCGILHNSKKSVALLPC